MQAIRRCLPLFLLSALPALPAAAQQDLPELMPYRVEITVRETGARGPATARKYTLVTGTRGSGSFRANQRVPYLISRSADQQAPPQYQFAESNLFIECKVTGGAAASVVHLSISLDFTTSVFEEKRPEAGGPPPAPQSMRVSLDSPMRLGARTVIGSLDDPVLGRRMDVEGVVSRVP